MCYWRGVNLYLWIIYSVAKQSQIQKIQIYKINVMGVKQDYGWIRLGSSMWFEFIVKKKSIVLVSYTSGSIIENQKSLCHYSVEQNQHLLNHHFYSSGKQFLESSEYLRYMKLIRIFQWHFQENREPSALLITNVGITTK